MNESVTTTRLPWAGIVVSTLSLIVMAGISWTLWDSLPIPSSPGRRLRKGRERRA